MIDNAYLPGLLAALSILLGASRVAADTPGPVPLIDDMVKTTTGDRPERNTLDSFVTAYGAAGDETSVLPWVESSYREGYYVNALAGAGHCEKARALWRS